MIKDDCKHLTLAQVERLLVRDGLGKSVEYDVEALEARRLELLNDSAASPSNEWDKVDPTLWRSGDALLIAQALEIMTVVELANYLRCSKQAISLWRNEKRKLPALERHVINLLLAGHVNLFL
jgi:hypothetical protein